MRRVALIAGSLTIFGFANAAYGNSCANVDVIGAPFDATGLQESEQGEHGMISAAGTFRIEGEQDESKQPMFNLSLIYCEKKFDEIGRATGFECKVTRAVVWSQSGEPNTDNPNCSLDLESSEYSMKELQKGTLTGMAFYTSACYNSMLTIDRTAKRVYLSFTKTQDADGYDKAKPNICERLPPTEVLMNCTAWPRIRKQGQTPPRYCDFSTG
jgi:hypothetical protein